METSGWPKNQKRCCHRRGSPPLAGLKKPVPKLRSKYNKIVATVMLGKEKTIKNEVTSWAQTNNGMRLNFMPGARKLKMVIMMLSAPSTVPAPRICKPNTQKSMPCVGEVTDSGV